jgi:predicted phosphodiesterase
MLYSQRREHIKGVWMEIHEIVSKLKALFQELGRPPTRDEFLDHTKLSHHSLRRHGGYVALMKASGIDMLPGQQKRFKAGPEIFQVDLKKHLDEYKSRDPVIKTNWPRILCIGDAHFPFVNQRVIDEILKFAEIHQPEYIVQMGDLYDFLSHSKFPRSHNFYTPEQEEQLARDGAEKFFRDLRRVCPNAKIHLLVGNHDLRPLKRVLEVLPSVEHWAQKIFKDLMTFEGVITHLDHREELEIGDILFTHGFLHREGAHRDYYLQSVVIGHLHKLWAQYRRVRGQQIFEMCVGFIGDPESKALTYTPSKKANYQLGFGWIDEFGCRVIHL